MNDQPKLDPDIFTHAAEFVFDDPPEVASRHHPARFEYPTFGCCYGLVAAVAAIECKAASADPDVDWQMEFDVHEFDVHVKFLRDTLRPKQGEPGAASAYWYGAHTVENWNARMFGLLLCAELIREEEKP